MTKELQKLRAELYRKRILADLIRIMAISILVGVIFFTFDTEIFLTPLVVGGVFFVASIVVAVLMGRFKQPSTQEIIRFLDRAYPFMEESASLMNSESSESSLEYWQKEKILKLFRSKASEIKIPNDELKRGKELLVSTSISTD